MEERGRLLAPVPWVPIVNNPDLKLEDSAVFKNVQFRSKAEKEQQIAIFKNLNKMFPFYIPIEHHRMNVNGMVKNRPNGQYWAVALHFLISSKGHNQYAWNEFQKHLDAQSKGKNINNSTCAAPYISDFTMNTWFPEGNPPQCRKLVGYFSDDWVRMQLEFQPVLFHQWLVALMVPVIKISMELSELAYLPSGLHGKAQEDIIRVFKWTRSAWDYVSQGFSFLQACAELNSNFEELKKKFPGITFPHHFVFHHSDVLKVIRSSKKLAWGNSQVALSKIDCDVYQPALLNIYDLEFWTNTKSQRRKIFYNPAEQDAELREEEDEELDGTNLEIDELLESLQVHCNHNLVFTERLKLFLFRDNIFVRAILDLKRIEEISISMRFRKEEHGTIGSIMSIMQYNLMSIAANKAKMRICEVSGVDPSRLLRVNYDDLPDVKLFEDFNAKILRDYSKNDKFWFEQKPLEETLDHKIGTVDKNIPSYNKDPFQIANRFVGRIKKLVQNRIAMHREVEDLIEVSKERGNNHEVNDWQFAQYLLPCFVASMLKLFTQTQNIDEHSKTFYIEVVDKLIAAYEDFEGIDFGLEEKYLPLFLKKRFACPNLLKAFIESTIRDDFYLEKKQETFVKHFKNDLQRLLTFNEVLDNSCKYSPSAEISSQTNRHYDLVTFDFFLNLQNALSVNQDILKKLFIMDPNVISDAMNHLIKVLCHVGFHPKNIVDDVPPGLDTSSIQLLALVKYCLRQKDAKDDLTGVHRLKKPDKSLDALMKNAREECENLTESKRQSLAFYLAMKIIPRENFSMLLNKKSTQSCLDHVLEDYVKGEKMLLLKYFLNRIKNMSLQEKPRVSHIFAKEKAPVLYYVALNEVGRSSNKIKIHCPGETWFFPIDHCRNCGLVDIDGSKIHQCFKCSIIYSPDTHFFCSEECQKSAMDTYHAKQHEEFHKKLVF